MLNKNNYFKHDDIYIQNKIHKKKKDILNKQKENKTKHKQDKQQ